MRPARAVTAIHTHTTHTKHLKPANKYILERKRTPAYAQEWTDRTYAKVVHQAAHIRAAAAAQAELEATRRLPARAGQLVHPYRSWW